MISLYIYIYNSLIRFNKGTPKNKRNSSDSWGGCVVKLLCFPAICWSRKPTTSSEDGRYWVSPPFSEFTRQMTSLDIAPSKNGRCILIDRINTTNKLRTSLFHTHFNLFHRQSTIFVETCYVFGATWTMIKTYGTLDEISHLWVQILDSSDLNRTPEKCMRRAVQILNLTKGIFRAWI